MEFCLGLGVFLIFLTARSDKQEYQCKRGVRPCGLAGRTLLVLAAVNYQLKSTVLPNLAERAPCPATAGNEVGKIPRACFLQRASFNQKQAEDYLKAAILADFAGECELSHLQQIRYSGSSIFNCRQKSISFTFFNN